VTPEVSFELSCETAFGETLVVVGGAPELGEWDIAKGVPLQTSPEVYPVWCSEAVQLASAAPEQVVEYKYIKVCHGGHQWEGGANRTLAVHDCAADFGKTMYLADGDFVPCERPKLRASMRSFSSMSLASTGDGMSVTDSVNNHISDRFQDAAEQPEASEEVPMRWICSSELAALEEEDEDAAMAEPLECDGIATAQHAEVEGDEEEEEDHGISQGDKEVEEEEDEDAAMAEPLECDGIGKAQSAQSFDIGDDGEDEGDHEFDAFWHDDGPTFLKVSRGSKGRKGSKEEAQQQAEEEAAEQADVQCSTGEALRNEVIGAEQAVSTGACDEDRTDAAWSAAGRCFSRDETSISTASTQSGSPPRMVSDFSDISTTECVVEDPFLGENRIECIVEEPPVSWIGSSELAPVEDDELGGKIRPGRRARMSSSLPSALLLFACAAALAAAALAACTPTTRSRLGMRLGSDVGQAVGQALRSARGFRRAFVPPPSPPPAAVAWEPRSRGRRGEQ